MRTPKNGVTKHHVLGLEVVTADRRYYLHGRQDGKERRRIRPDRINVRQRGYAWDYYRGDAQAAADAGGNIYRAC
ncbi:MAG: hypothetical protein IPP63_14795 [Chloracidobacterium sp.]|nr:hypothetical protein [Chloracidobacterium sp.]